MISAAEARAGAATAAEENKVKFEQEAEAVIEAKIEPAIKEAISEGQMSLALSLKGYDGRVAALVYEKLAQAGFDVAVALPSFSEEGNKLGDSWFTLYWSKDRGGNPGNITRPKFIAVG